MVFWGKVIWGMVFWGKVIWGMVFGGKVVWGTNIEPFLMYLIYIST
jgi:hypothetical protein